MCSLCGCRLQLLRKQQPISLPDLIARFHANPLRDRSVLLLLLSKEAFDLERLVRRLQERAAVSPPRQPPAQGSSAGPGPPPPRELSRASAGARSRRARARPPPPRAVRRPAGRKASARRGWESRTRGPPPPPPRLPGIPTQPATARELGVSRRGDGCRPMVSPWRVAARRPGDGGGGRGGRGGGKRRERGRGLRRRSAPWRAGGPPRAEELSEGGRRHEFR